VADGAGFSAVVAGRKRAMCCAGCAAVARLIDGQGLSRFYEFRTSPALRPDTELHQSFATCDRPEVMDSILEPGADENRATMRCQVEGLTCAACTWLINKAVRDIRGVAEFSVNPLTSQAEIVFDSTQTRPSEMLGAMARYGFSARPLPRASATPKSVAGAGELRRLAVAGLGFAQIMSLSAALYLGAFKSMSPHFESFLTLASLLIATPVVLYAGAPIFRNALRDIIRRHIGMDLPVGLAIAAALTASIFNALRGSGPVFFDSATMFVFFLTLGRFLEARARFRAGRTYQSVEELVPFSATRIRDGRTETVGSIEISPGDLVLVPPGEAAPADGTLVSERASVDESLLSGETNARSKSCGEPILGGTLNVGSHPIEMHVTAIGCDSYLGRVSRLLETALQSKPPSVRSAEKWASRIAAGLLLLSAVVGLIWLTIAPQEAFRVVLSMLVVTCPCAISLAAPAAFATGLGALARQGLLLRSTEVIDRLLDVRTWLFDKTGTVTDGIISIVRIQPFADLDTQQCLQIAMRLEAGIEHPLARAFVAGNHPERAQHVEYFEGQGVTGSVDGRTWRLGSAAFAGVANVDRERGVWLTDGTTVFARFEFSERVRPYAPAAMQMLQQSGMNVALVSGDDEAAVRAAADRLDIDQYHAAALPERKLALLRELQQAGQHVIAVGDGVNDAPLLAQADVSIAMVSGSELARASADIVFTGEDLRIVAMLPAWAAQVRRTIRQNIGWAIAYNLTGIPLAAAGLVPPWLAALGMSLSSLLVVLNGLRLGAGLRSTPRASNQRRGSHDWLMEPS
jgi:Cu2+-exporting ATPase